MAHFNRHLLILAFLLLAATALSLPMGRYPLPFGELLRALGDAFAGRALSQGRPARRYPATSPTSRPMAPGQTVSRVMSAVSPMRAATVTQATVLKAGPLT